jgi:hypothetical protein
MNEGSWMTFVRLDMRAAAFSKNHPLTVHHNQRSHHQKNFSRRLADTDGSPPWHECFRILRIGKSIKHTGGIITLVSIGIRIVSKPLLPSFDHFRYHNALL